MKRRKLSVLNKTQYQSLWNLMSLLKDMKVFTDYHITSRQYYDTIMTYNNKYSTTVVDTQWTALHEVEGVFIIDGRSDIS